MKNTSKLIFFLMILFSTMFLASASSWLTAWMGLEINLISFISFIMMKKKMNSMEASIIYFIFQSLASLLFLYSSITYMFNFMMFYYILNNFSNLILMSLLMKIGSAPFHFWLPLTMEGLSWMNNYMLMTWQKLGPMILILISINFKFLMSFILMSAIMGALGGLNQSSIKKLMSFSSISQISWLLISMLMSKFLWKIYYLFYFFISMSILMIFNTFNLIYLHQLFNIKLPTMMHMFLFLNILSMGGLPPLLGFFPKMLVIMALNFNFTMTMIIMFTLMTLFYYLRLMYSSLIFTTLKINMMPIILFNLKSMIYMTFFMNLFLLFFLIF